MLYYSSFSHYESKFGRIILQESEFCTERERERERERDYIITIFKNNPTFRISILHQIKEEGAFTYKKIPSL